MVAEVVREFPQLDVLVNMRFQTHTRPDIEEFSTAALGPDVRNKCLRHFWLSRAALPLM